MGLDFPVVLIQLNDCELFAGEKLGREYEQELIQEVEH